MTTLRSKLIRLAADQAPDSPLRRELLTVLASNQASWVAIFDSLRPGRKVQIAMTGVMTMDKVTDGKFHEWIVNRRSFSKKYNTETISLLHQDGSKPSKYNAYALRKRTDRMTGEGRVSASVGDMGLFLKGLKL